MHCNSSPSQFQIHWENTGRVIICVYIDNVRGKKVLLEKRIRCPADIFSILKLKENLNLIFMYLFSSGNYQGDAIEIFFSKNRNYDVMYLGTWLLPHRIHLNSIQCMSTKLEIKECIENIFIFKKSKVFDIAVNFFIV